MIDAALAFIAGLVIAILYTIGAIAVTIYSWLFPPKSKVGAPGRDSEMSASEAWRHR